MSDWKIGEQVIDSPAEFHIEPKRIKRERRLASGKLVCDVKAIKNRFRLVYDILTQSDMTVFKNVYEGNEFVTFEYRQGGAWQTATVWMRSLPLEMVNETPEYWGQMTISLEEQ